jgi:hypothetical protein
VKHKFEVGTSSDIVMNDLVLTCLSISVVQMHERNPDIESEV